MAQIPEAWGDETMRQSVAGSPHRETECIYLRMPPIIDVSTLFHSLVVMDWPRLVGDPAFEQAISDVAFAVGKLPARVMFAKLHAGGFITPHIDQGVYAEFTERYHVAVVTNPDCVMCIDDEYLAAAPGEVWWFDKHHEHSVLNAGEADRVHLIVDCWH